MTDSNTKNTLNTWTRWRSFPDPRSGGYLFAPFGPGVYELRNQTIPVLFGRGKNVASRMSSLLPHPLGYGTRNNLEKREYVEQHLSDIEYRTMACEDVRSAKDEERKLRSRKNWVFDR